MMSGQKQIPAYAIYVWPVALFCLMVVMQTFRVSDLHLGSQATTISYTVDIVQNGHWILPEDVDGPATKPPLYNWVSLPGVLLAGYSPFTFKLPSILASFAILLMVMRAARHVDLSEVNSEGQAHIPALMMLTTGLVWVASPLVSSTTYFARPDMLMTAFLTAGWLLATDIIQARSSNPNRIKTLALWLCVAGASLAKGPIAYLVVLYIFLFSKWRHGSLQPARQTGWRWGLPLALAIFAIWLGGAYVKDATHVRNQLIGYEFVNRILGTNALFGADQIQASQIQASVPTPIETPASAVTSVPTKALDNSGFVNVMDRPWIAERQYLEKNRRRISDVYAKPWYQAKAFLRQFAPWSLVLLLGLAGLAGVVVARTPRLNWAGHPMAPAALWCGLVFIAFCLPTIVRGRYLLPALPAASIWVAYLLVGFARQFGLQRYLAFTMGLAALGCTLVLGIWDLKYSAGSSEFKGENTLEFVRNVKEKVGDSGIVFNHFGGENAVQSLLGYSQVSSPTTAQFEAAQWLIQPYGLEMLSQNGETYTITSDGRRHKLGSREWVSKPIHAMTVVELRCKSANPCKGTLLGLYKIR